ncbi:carboxylesterase 5A-like [Lissotriton helveticus]
MPGCTGSPAPIPRVHSKHGWLEGVQLTVEGTERPVSAYLGVPFAKAPTGSRRFAGPEPAEPWSDVKSATAAPPVCPQPIETLERLSKILEAKFPAFSMSEDCLYLNVYTPADAGKTSKLPVMVWIHGGGLTMGSASFIHGSALSAYEDVVVVSMQYRLGVLGFLSTGDEHAAGNWGFLDQVAALKWVKESIEDFGGNPDSVTIFGESAGGISTSAHLLSPLSKGLFHRAISQSGVLVYPGLVIDQKDVVHRTAQTIANISGCEISDSSAMVACLRGKAVADFLTPAMIQKLPFVPGVVDGHFLPKTPLQLLEEKEIIAVPHMIGLNNQEFGWVMPLLFNLPDLRDGMDNKTLTLATSLLKALLGPLDAFRELILSEYLRDAKDNFQIRDNILELFGDILFTVQSILRARYHRDAGLPAYLYEFSHRPSRYQDSRPPYVKADHADEVPFVFGAPFMDIGKNGGFTEKEKALSKTMMKQWANFARSGSPNGDGLPEWPLYDGEEKYLALDLEPEVGAKLKANRVDFWTQTLPKIIEEAQKHQKEPNAKM